MLVLFIVSLQFVVVYGGLRMRWCGIKNVEVSRMVSKAMTLIDNWNVVYTDEMTHREAVASNGSAEE